VGDFKEDSISFKTLPQLRVEEVKNLSLVGYRSLLNTEPLGGEGVPIFCIVSCSIAKKNI
jgi:hypothetical protein